MKGVKRKTGRSFRDPEGELGVSAPCLRMWRSLSPAERLKRPWRPRGRLKNLAAIHEAKTFPGL